MSSINTINHPRTFTPKQAHHKPNLFRLLILSACLLALCSAAAPLRISAFKSKQVSAEVVQPEINRIEQAATPKAFTYIRIINNSGSSPLELHGNIALGQQSDGLNPASDRIVIVLGSNSAVLEPGSLRPSGQSNRVWTYQNQSNPLVSKLILQKLGDYLWQFELGAAQPQGSNRLYIRVGNDWGGIDLTTGELFLQMQPQLDTSHHAQATIGSAGGTIQTTDAAGVKIKLDVPADALDQDTLIMLTPLQSSPLVAGSGALIPGVKFEPEGLQFALPATLTLDFSATGHSLTNQDFVFLLMSPLTAVPLFSPANHALNTMTAWLNHFSVIQPGTLSAALTDLAAWADPILSAAGNTTFSELASLAALAAVQQQSGCTSNCISLSALAQRAQASFNALVSSTCSSGTANPTDQALQRLLNLDAVGQSLGLDSTAVRSCERQVFRALIIDYGSRALINPSDTNLVRLLNAAVRAQQLGFDDLDTLALQKLDAALRALLTQAQQICPTDSTIGKALLNRALAYASAVAAFGIDTGLQNDLQQAISNCGGGGLGGSYAGTFEYRFYGGLIVVTELGDLNVNGNIVQVRSFGDLGEVTFGSRTGDGEYFSITTASGNTISAHSSTYRRCFPFGQGCVDTPVDRTLNATLVGNTLSGSIVLNAVVTVTFHLTTQ
jgi:hypothetical protein